MRHDEDGRVLRTEILHGQLRPFIEARLDRQFEKALSTLLQLQELRRRAPGRAELATPPVRALARG